MLFQKDKKYGNEKHRNVSEIDRKKLMARERNKNKTERKRSRGREILISLMVRKVQRIISVKDVIRKLSEKVSSCTLPGKCRQASLALETALVLPLFFLGMVTMISFMDIYRIQTVHLQALCEKTKEAGMYAYVLDGKGPKEVTMPDVYAYTPIGALVPLPKVWMHNTVKVHAWTGADETELKGDAKEPEKMVYVTESGTVYHRKPGCRYLNVKINQIAGSSVAHAHNASGQKYSPCESCSRNQKPSGVVYVTSSGNRYHNLATCSGLKRTVKLVKESQLGGMHACSSCG